MNARSPVRRFALSLTCMLPLFGVVGTLAVLSGCKTTHMSPEELSAEERDRRIRESYRQFAAGQRAQKAGNLEEARGYYTQAVDNNPDLSAAWNNLGIVLMEGDKPDYLNAAASLRKAAELSPSDPRPYENLGLVYRRAKWFEDSVRYYGMSLERDPNYLPSLRGYVLGAVEISKIDETLLEHVKRALLIETDPAWRLEFERFKLRTEGELRNQKENK